VSVPCRRLVVAWLAALGLSAVAVAQAPEVGDALGAGLTPPTAARYADPAWYDLLDARWASDPDGSTVFEIELAAIDPEAPLLQPIVEAYLMDPDAVGLAALPGTGLAAPDEAGWAVAVRVAGPGAWVWTAGPDAQPTARSVGFEVVGRTVRVPWPTDLPAEGAWVAVSGVYDPFSDTGWRPFAAEASPWAFAGPLATPPVVSVVPGGNDALLRLHATARLPRGAARVPLGGASPWWWWMGGGLVLVVVGLVWRGRSRPAPVATPVAAAAVAGPPELIGDEDLAAVPDEGATDAAGNAANVEANVAANVEAEERQSEAVERSDDAVVATSDGAADVDAAPEAPSSSRTTRAPSPARRSAKRS